MVKSSRFYGVIEIFCFNKVIVLFSIKRTGFQIFKTSLLNVPYNPKNEVLNSYKTSTYNREHRVDVMEKKLRFKVSASVLNQHSQTLR